MFVYLASITLLTVAQHRQEHIFPDFSLTTFKFTDFSMFTMYSRLVDNVDLQLNTRVQQVPVRTIICRPCCKLLISRP